MPDPTPEERLRLLDPAQDPPRWGPGATVRAWRDPADARLAVLQEAVEVLADLAEAPERFLNWPELSPELAHLLAAQEWRADGGEDNLTMGDTPEDYLAAMKADGLQVREIEVGGQGPSG